MKNPYFSLSDILPTDRILVLSFSSLNTIKSVGDEVIITVLPRRSVNISP
jgi:hypothetical protein